jgi:signal transduction histidine kinase
MTPFVIQTLFLFYSALSFLSAALIGTLFWKRNDRSAMLWLCGCLLTSIATVTTIHRNEIPLTISFSLMVSLEALSVLLFSESLKRLSRNQANISLSWTTFVIPIALFVLVEVWRLASDGKVTPAITAATTLTFAITNIFCLYRTIRVKKEFQNKLFFDFLSIVFGLVSTLYLLRLLIIVSGYSGQSFDIKTLNVIVWFGLFLFGAIRNLAYIVLRLHLGFSEHTRLSSMNIQLSDLLDERNEMILSLQKLNRTASINALASTISHEINQPLAASRINAQMADLKLASDPPNVPFVRNLVGHILEDIDRASTIVQNVSRLTTNKSSNQSVIHLSESIHEVIEIARGQLRERGIMVELACSSEIKISINKSEWQQVLLNLINNAIQSLADGKPAQKKIHISATQTAQHIKIFIEDTGPGIELGQESKIFELAFSNKESGSGIGLWLSKNIIRNFGGDITAQNLVNGGACFVIKLPRAPQQR